MFWRFGIACCWTIFYECFILNRKIEIAFTLVSLMSNSWQLNLDKILQPLSSYCLFTFLSCCKGICRYLKKDLFVETLNMDSMLTVSGILYLMASENQKQKQKKHCLKTTHNGNFAFNRMRKNENKKEQKKVNKIFMKCSDKSISSFRSKTCQRDRDREQ